jgi:murein DD-endopeptidase MepM/ murein hydrolase activator NlpD
MRRWFAALLVVATLPVVVTSHASSLPALPSTPAPSSSSDPSLALAALDRRVADLDTEEQTNKLELSRLGAEATAEHARVLVRGRELYKLTRAGLLPVGGGFDALVKYAMRVERARRQLLGSVHDEEKARSRASEVERELERVARDRADLATQRTAMDAARMAMADEQRRQAAFDRAFQSSTGPGSDYVAVYGGSGLSSDPPAGGFSGARGRLLFPVVGRAEVRPARREGTDGPGLEVHAPAGSAVRAVYAGRVAFAERYGPYGRIVILDHGDRYYTVSGNLDAIDVRVGQDVTAGERIGTVGDDGQGAMLYFEVRHGSQTVSPAAWLGL